MISASKATEQALIAARQYLHVAKDDIDKLFGEGYAKANPALVAAHMQTVSAEYQAWTYLHRTEVLHGGAA